MYFQTNTNQSQINLQSWRCLFCWMLCICVWRGPIPVLHSHSLAISDLGANESLAEHAVRFHSEHLGEADSGFHIHFLVLTPCQGSLLCPAVEHAYHLASDAELWCDVIVKDMSLDGFDSKEWASLDGLMRVSPIKAQRPGDQENTFAISLLSQSSLISSFGVALI